MTELDQFAAISKSAGFTAIALGIFTVIMVIVKHLFIPKKFWPYVPNWNAVGLVRFAKAEVPPSRFWDYR